MFGRGSKEENGKRQGYALTVSQVLQQLEKEVQLLNCKKKYFLDTKKVLLFMINEKNEAKIKKNQKLRLEVEKYKRNCVKLVKILNASIKWDLVNTARLTR